jgi:hypothetical protein
MIRKLFVWSIPIGLHSAIHHNAIHHNAIHHNAILKLSCQHGTKEEETKE